MSLIIAERALNGVTMYADGRATINGEIISENEKKIFRSKYYLFGFSGEVRGGIQEAILRFEESLSPLLLRGFILNRVLPLLKIGENYEKMHLEFLVTDGEKIYRGSIETGDDNSVCISEEYDKYAMIGGAEQQARAIRFASNLTGIEAIKNIYDLTSRINWSINSNITTKIIEKT